MAFHRRTWTRPDFAAAQKPYRGERQRHRAHDDFDGVPVEIAQREVTEPDADDERGEQHRKVDARPGVRPPIAQRRDIHDHEQGASSAPAAIGSIASESRGMPTMAKPPPNAPFMKAIRNTPESAIASVKSPGMSDTADAITGAPASISSRPIAAAGAVSHSFL